MNIVLLQTASGPIVKGPVVRVPFGNYKIEKHGNYESCKMSLNGSDLLDVNSRIILSDHSSIKLIALQAEDLTVRFIRES